MLIKDEVTPQDLANYPDSENYLALDDDAVEPHDYNVYASVATARNDWIVIQYWFFYVYDDKPLAGKHEGDWEMIQIELTPYGDPLFVGYSQHYGGEWAYWWDIERDGDRPVVYVSRGGHASYFESGSKEYVVTRDHHHGDGIIIHPRFEPDYNITMLETQDWLKFKGRWGADSRSVPGPVFRHSKPIEKLPSGPVAYIWIEPVYWMQESLKLWDG